MLHLNLPVILICPQRDTKANRMSVTENNRDKKSNKDVRLLVNDVGSI
jgi:flagellar motor switch protein FliM